MGDERYSQLTQVNYSGVHDVRNRGTQTHFFVNYLGWPTEELKLWNDLKPRFTMRTRGYQSNIMLTIYMKLFSLLTGIDYSLFRESMLSITSHTFPYCFIVPIHLTCNFTNLYQLSLITIQPSFVSFSFLMMQ